MKKVLILFLIVVLTLLCLIGCGKKEEQASATPIQVERIDVLPTSSVGENSSDKTKEGIDSISTDKNLFTVEITIPASYKEGETQESLDESIKDEEGIKSATLNADGSVTYVMTKSAHEKMLTEMSSEIKQSLVEFTGADYPNISRIEANDNFSSYDVYTKSSELALEDSLLPLGLYMISGMYHSFSGETVDNIHVNYINEATGETFNTADSRDMAN